MSIIAACSGLLSSLRNNLQKFIDFDFWVGGGLTSNTILIIGFATLLSNSLTMGISEFLSSKAHKEFLQAEKRREMWEFKHYKDGEIQEVSKSQTLSRR